MNNQNQKELELLLKLGALPKHMTKHHGMDNLVEFVLHGMCKDAFGITKAAYFMNNSDFDILRGVAGYHDVQSYCPINNHWDEKYEFTLCMKEAEFNQLVRAFAHKSFKKGHQSSEKEMVERIAHQLGFKDPMYHAWDLKYDNHGLFVFDHPGSSHVDNHLYDFLHMFSFCPVY